MWKPLSWESLCQAAWVGLIKPPPQGLDGKQCKLDEQCGFLDWHKSSYRRHGTKPWQAQCNKTLLTGRPQWVGGKCWPNYCQSKKINGDTELFICLCGQGAQAFLKSHPFNVHPCYHSVPNMWAFSSLASFLLSLEAGMEPSEWWPHSFVLSGQPPRGKSTNHLGYQATLPDSPKQTTEYWNQEFRGNQNGPSFGQGSPGRGLLAPWQKER